MIWQRHRVRCATIQVRVPSGNSSQVRFLADIQNMQVNVTPQDAKVVINSRTGSVVMNRGDLDSCAVAQVISQ